MTVATDVFATLGASVADRIGMPDLRFVIVPHPVAHLSEDDLESLADSVFDEIRRALTESP